MTERTIITVGTRLAPFASEGNYFDGIHPVERAVTMRFDEAAAGLIIDLGEGDTITWPFKALRRLPDQAGSADIMLAKAPWDDPARLLLPAVDLRILRSRASGLDRRRPTQRRGRLAILGLAAVASVSLMLAVLIPLLADKLAEILPAEGEVALGEATLDHVRSALDDTGLGLLPVCEAEAGRAALGALESRLGVGIPVRLQVLDHPMVNAFALPGGLVVIFRGLLDAADTPEEVAAVLAHEVGHVAARDPTRIALRSAGSIGVLGLMFGDFAGGAMVLFLTERIISADYTQAAEAAADAYAHALLIEADLSPAALADLFERLLGDVGQAPPIVQHFLAHPAMADRIDAARAAVPEGFQARPALSPEDWAALLSICAEE